MINTEQSILRDIHFNIDLKHSSGTVNSTTATKDIVLV